MEVCRKIKGNLSSDVLEGRTSTGSVLFTLSSRSFEHIREKTHRNTTNLVVPRHIARKKIHFRLKTSLLKLPKDGGKWVSTFRPLSSHSSLLPTFLSTQRNRELKQQRRQRLRKSHLKSEFALPQILSRL